MATTMKIEKKQLQSLNIEFIEKMDAMPTFLDYAIKKKLLLKEHGHLISAETGENQTRQMLSFIETKLPSKSHDFLYALVNSGNTALAQKLVPETSITDLEKLFLDKPKPSTTIEFQHKYQIRAEKLRNLRVDFINFMSDMPTFIDYALQINLFNKQHKNEILSDANVDNQTRKMCDIIDKKLPEKSDEFLYALNESGNEYLADLLLPNETCDFEYLKINRPAINRVEKAGSYPMTKRGRVVIIENVDFPNPDYYRDGSEKDREALESYFSELGFEVIVKRNLTAEEMKEFLHDEINNEKGDNEDCFILFILSHGRISEIYGTDEKTMNYSVIYNEFNNSRVWKDNEKPKLIFLQTCQIGQTSKEQLDAQNVSRENLPSGHFYIMYATIPGKYAYRKTDSGSRLIQSLIKIYKENYLTEDIETMGIKIKKNMYTIPDSKNYQIAVCHSSLVKNVYLGLA